MKIIYRLVDGKVYRFILLVVIFSTACNKAVDKTHIPNHYNKDSFGYNGKVESVYTEYQYPQNYDLKNDSSVLAVAVMHVFNKKGYLTKWKKLYRYDELNHAYAFEYEGDKLEYIEVAHTNMKSEFIGLEYNAEGLLEQELYYDFDSVPKAKVLYNYTNNHISEKLFLSINGKLENRVLIQRDSLDRPLQVLELDGKGDTLFVDHYRYNANGDVLEHLSFSASKQNSVLKEEAQYNKRGDLISYKSEYYGGKLKEDQTILKSYAPIDPKQSARYYFDYDYDENDNWLEQIIYVVDNNIKTLRLKVIRDYKFH